MAHSTHSLSPPPPWPSRVLPKLLISVFPCLFPHPLYPTVPCFQLAQWYTPARFPSFSCLLVPMPWPAPVTQEGAGGSPQLQTPVMWLRLNFLENGNLTSLPFPGPVCLSCLQQGTRMRMSRVRRGCHLALTMSCTS